MKSDFDMLESRLASDHCDLTILRNGEKLLLENFDLTRKQLTDAEGRTGMYLGIYFRETPDRNLGNVLKTAAWQCVDFTRLVWYGLTDLFTGKASLKDMSGVLGAVDYMVQGGEAQQTVLDGVLYVLYFGAFLAVNLAVMNMLPIPALDGGRVLFLLINTIFTAITGKKINPKYEGYIHAAAMVLLLGLMAVLLIKDVVMIARR